MKQLGPKRLDFFSFTKHVLPSVVMMIFMSLYTIVDGAFIARFVGPNALAGTNLVYPINNLILGIGIMFATGANARISILRGEGRDEEARRKFTLSLASCSVLGLLCTVLLLLFLRPILQALGANEALYSYCFQYAIVLALSAPITILKEVLVSFLLVDGRPRLSLFATVFGGVLNIFLDYLFVKVWGLGVFGAAIATTLGILCSALLALWYFLSGRSNLKFCRFQIDRHFLFVVMGNGSSEMVNQVSSGITTLVFNLIALRFYGSAGVAAVTVIQYSQFIFISLFLGLSMGAAPLLSYNYGAGDFASNRRILRYCAVLVVFSSVALFGLAHFHPQLAVLLFVKEGTQVYELARSGLALFSFSLLFAGANIFTSGLFTALGNGVLSALIALCRSFLFLLPALFFLPKLFGFTGLWLSVPVAEIITAAVVLACLLHAGKRYSLWGPLPVR